MTERKFNPVKLWPLPVCAAIAAWEVWEANQQTRELDWLLLGLLGAGALFVVIVRVFMRV
jgi:hypothetical protein